MKRIITCPKCEAKLAIFDFGKPINQKCPKCGNAFVIESEENKAEAKKPEQADDAKQTAEPVPAPAAEAAAAAEAKGAAAAAASVPAVSEKKPGKENGKKKTAPVTDAAAAVPAAAPAAEPAVTPAVTPAAAPAVTPAAAPAVTQTPAEEKKDAAPKEIKVKKPTESSAFVPKARTPDKADLSASDVPETPEQPAGGGSFISRLVVVGLLFLIIILQVIAKAQSNKQYGKIIEHLQFIETKLAK